MPALEVEEDVDPDSGTLFNTVEGATHRLTHKAITQTPFKHYIKPSYFSFHNSPSRIRTSITASKGSVIFSSRRKLALAFLGVKARLKTLKAVGDEAVGSSGIRGDPVAEKKIRKRAEWAFARSLVWTVVISPTGELATQIANAVLKLSKYHGFNVQLFVGGESQGTQTRIGAKAERISFVGTPGRIQVKEALTKLVLDEADTLFDRGFRSDIENITSYLPPIPVCQTLLFSVAVSADIR
ncbi:hypothetical protein FRB96_008038 [Tulasnella sp. 330]|nr:hypothetical protein FRB96_008038 [Tulasnella sp. 330]